MEITGLITALVIGLIIGALGRLVAPARQHMPIWLAMLFGIAAAGLGTVLASAVGVGTTAGIDWIELILQVVFAALCVATVARIYGRPAARPDVRKGGPSTTLNGPSKLEEQPTPRHGDPPNTEPQEPR